MASRNIAVGNKRFDNYVVAIGASAGGLEAIHQFFDHMPANASFSFVIIQHLSSDYKSLLVELVAKHTHMKVFEAGHNMAIQQDCVYIIPNNKLMTVEKGRLKLADKSLIKAPNTAVDHFLYTLAKDKQEKAIAIILSGTGTDGTKGVQEIKNHGGLVIVQDPATAKFDGMPNSAIASGNADFILSPDAISDELFNYANEEPVKVLENGQLDEQLLDEIFSLVQQHSGNDFNLYKTPTIIRRIGRRMNEKGIRTLEAYVDLLKNMPQEVLLLGEDFLIGVTQFFRDPLAFDAFAQHVKEVIAKKENSDTLKIWVCACSTGQEAYSIAIVANEAIEKSGKVIDLKVFATDIDERSIEIAAKNQYPASVEKEIPAKLFKKYFIQDGKHYCALPSIRKQIVFAKHDVSKSPPFIKTDMITCRNMLIYVNSTLQEKILSIFHFSLVQNGYLFLGSSETANSLKHGLTEISRKWKIYQKTGTLNYANYNTYHTGAYAASDKKKSNAARDVVMGAKEKEFNRFITDELGYTAVYIDKTYIIKDTIGEYRKYLSLPGSKLELNILKMVPKALTVTLGTAIRKAWKSEGPVHLKRLKYSTEEGNMLLNISITPSSSDVSTGYTMIVFGESMPENIITKDESPVMELHEGNQNEYIFELEQELNDTRNSLQLAVESMETTNEELQSTNEELLSANEELQSSNEELQSLNEELHTLNTEHQLKIKELMDLNDDLDNYFRTIEIGQIFIDADMYIRKFNPAAINMVNLIEADIGRSIAQISNNIKTENLNTDLQAVLNNSQTIEKEVQLQNGHTCLMRITPYVRKDKKTDGVVVTFVDISKLTELNNIIAGVFHASLNGVMAFKAIRNKQHLIVDFECIALNDVASALLNKDRSQLLHGKLLDQMRELTAGNLLKKYITVVEKGTVLKYEYQLTDKIWIQVVAVKMSDGFAATITDISQQKIAEERIKKNYNELLGTRESLKHLNADLEVKVKERTRLLSESESRFNLVSHATNDTIWDWNLADNTIWRSSNFESIYGYARDHTTNTLPFYLNLIHPEERDLVRNSVYDAINNGEQQWTAQYRLIKSDGSYCSVLDRGSILFDTNGVPYRMVGSILDITILKATENKLNSTERKFRKIFDSNVIGMIFSDLETGRIENANHVFLSMLGYTAEDFELGNINWKEITPPEYIQNSELNAKLLRTQGFCPPFEKQYIARDGRLVDVLVGSAVLDEENKLDAVTYVIDISKQKQDDKRRDELQELVKKQQDEFHSIFKKAPALISIRRGKDLVYEFVNEAYARFDTVDNHVGSRMHENSQFKTPELAKIEQRVMQSGETYVASSYHFTTVDKVSGETVESWFDLILNPVYSEDGLIDGISFFGFDVTELMIAQRATKALMNKKDEFMSIASHELKTPVTSIKGFMQFALKMAKEEKFGNIFGLIDKADKQVGKLTRLIDDLLDVTKIQAGKLTFTKSDFDISEIVSEAIDGIQGNLDHQTIIKDVDNIIVCGDRNRIEQVISNFLSNAIKYAPNGKQITIRAKETAGKLKLSIRDQGIGIPKDKADFIFDRFFRVEESSMNFSGLGLGLYISAEIIQRHGGRIGVESEINSGSEFWFEIPLNAL
ncbi:two-component system, chemotaxis family, CheB/CheR fusion protein [Pedobacter westerhofensis]|uniref:Two-component system, chemotaxis family, CheB/CheR fusion protein n=1 Tax=Pedobacter westerhofensis TaxID=425512 RepID=A0A521BBP9_9SPHI|nr:chemotaxis protein CheB [Pedobacter westerhofensis]SMO44512.1 two-component system, chemotaxis family, CheB/CheR fusion protein [Pedobacter westerhofensis]